MVSTHGSIVPLAMFYNDVFAVWDKSDYIVNFSLLVATFPFPLLLLALPLFLFLPLFLWILFLFWTFPLLWTFFLFWFLFHFPLFLLCLAFLLCPAFLFCLAFLLWTITKWVHSESFGSGDSKGGFSGSRIHLLKKQNARIICSFTRLIHHMTQCQNELRN